MFVFWLFVQNPGACFIKAAKAGAVDDLKGNLDALAWGKVPSTGTGGHFDIIYSGKVDLILFLLVNCLINVRNHNFTRLSVYARDLVKDF